VAAVGSFWRCLAQVGAGYIQCSAPKKMGKNVFG